MRKVWMLIIIAMLTSCTAEDISSPGNNIELENEEFYEFQEEINQADEQQEVQEEELPLPAKLPEPYTMENIQAAIDEYINYVIWSNPPGHSFYYPYIGETFEAEVRIYADDSIYAVFDNLGGQQYYFELGFTNSTVYSGAIAEWDWPEGEYASAGKFELKILEPRKPNFGSSPHKDKLAAAARNYYQRSCELSQNSNSEEWKGTVYYYIGDFYEYSYGTSAWFIYPNGDTFNHPIYFSFNKDGTIDAVGMKGFYVEDIYSLPQDDYWRFMFDRTLEATIEVLACVIEGENE